MYARKPARPLSLPIDIVVHRRRFARAGRYVSQAKSFNKGTVMTIKLQLVDLGDAMVETRQLAILPLFIDNLTAFGLLPF